MKQEYAIYCNENDKMLTFIFDSDTRLSLDDKIFVDEYTYVVIGVV